MQTRHRLFWHNGNKAFRSNFHFFSPLGVGRSPTPRTATFAGGGSSRRHSPQPALGAFYIQKRHKIGTFPLILERFYLAPLFFHLLVVGLEPVFLPSFSLSALCFNAFPLCVSCLLVIAYTTQNLDFPAGLSIKRLSGLIFK